MLSFIKHDNSTTNSDRIIKKIELNSKSLRRRQNGTQIIPSDDSLISDLVVFSLRDVIIKTVLNLCPQSITVFVVLLIFSTSKYISNILNILWIPLSDFCARDFSLNN